MTRLQIVAFGVRFAGIYIFVDQVSMSAMTFVTILFNRPNDLPGAAIAVALLAVLATLFLGVAMIFLPLRLARWLIPGKIEEETEKVSFSFEEAQLLVFAGLGIYFVVPALSSMISYAKLQYLAGLNFADFFDLRIFLTNLFPYLLRLVVGLWLLIGGRGIIKLLQRLRTVGPRP